MTWETISSELGLAKLRESDIHPHVPEERAELFHSHDNGGTEFEFLNLIHAFVLATKPMLCIETGTYTGLGTIAIASALNWNGCGKLLTLDIDECAAARKLIADYGLGHLVEFCQHDASNFISSYQGSPFQFAFIDSGGGRLEETNALIETGNLSPGATVILHDASPLRNVGETVGSQFEKHCLIKGHTIPLSRGLMILFA